MSKIDYPVENIKGIVFDNDGVLSPTTVQIGDDGIPRRMANLKDGFSLHTAIKRGLKIAILSGAAAPGLRRRFEAIGIKDLFFNTPDKLPVLKQWMNDNGLTPEEVAYCGDDVPDVECLRYVGLGVCPADGSRDAKLAARYITDADGGHGVAREIIEEVLRANDNWPDKADSPVIKPGGMETDTDLLAQTKKSRVILASGSPRRRELLKMIVDDFEIANGKDVEEVYPEDLPVSEVPSFLSKLKASAYVGDLKQEDILITADTVVIIDDRILGKPENREDAIAMLSTLSGRAHTVITGVTITTVNGMQTFSQSTTVHFDEIPTEEIIHYVDRYQPYDKAGAYGIQEWIGAAAIKGIEGSFYNVMGLPVHALFLALRPLLDS